MTKVIHHRLFFSTLLGNVIEHYDTALFGLLAPFIAPLFFPQSDLIVGLILIYFPFSFLAKPLGAIFWGKKGDLYGRKKTLYFCLFGMSATLLITACLPVYSQIGLLAPFLLHLARGLTGFFAAGEGAGASLLLIESAPSHQKNLASSLYEMSSVLGTLLASLLITVLSFKNQVLEYWRFLFFISGFLGVMGLWLRRKTFLSHTPKQGTNKKFSWKDPSKIPYLPFLAIVFLTGLSCSNYLIAMKMFNAYIPIVTPIESYTMLAMHNKLLLIDFLLLAFFGWLSTKINKQILIQIALVLFMTLAFPLFKVLEEPSLTSILILRISLVTLGCAIAAPFNAFAIELLPSPYRFRLLALSRAIGSQFIGGFSISAALWSVKKTTWVGAPCFYLILCACFSLVLLAFTTKQKETQNSLHKAFE